MENLTENKGRFIHSPIVVKNSDGTTFQIIELDLIPFEDFMHLIIKDARGNTLLDRIFDGTEVTYALTVERELRKITIFYYDADENLVQETEKDIYYSGRPEEMREPAEERYARALEDVRKEIDRIANSGTMAENNFSIRVLNQSITSAYAKKFVFAQIRTIINKLTYVRETEIDNFIYRIYAHLYGMDILQELDDDPEVGEIMVNATEIPEFKCDVYYVKDQIKYHYDKTFTDVETLKNVLRRTIAFSNKEMNESENAIIEATRPNRDRVNLVIPTASDNYCLNIRKFSNFIPNLEMMKKSGTIDETIDQLMSVLVRGKANIGIGGPMGTGKTTLINFLLTYTPKLERKVVIAAINETDVDRVLRGHDVIVFNVNEERDHTFSNLVRTSLRTTADRVIIPESRGGEFKELYEANLKTKGNMFTAHAIDDVGFLDMCVDMYMSSPDAGQASTRFIKNKICKAIDIIVMMRRVGSKIRIKSISEILVNENNEYAGMNPIYYWDFDPNFPLEGQYAPTGNGLSEALLKRLNEHGVEMGELRQMNERLRRESEEYLQAKRLAAKNPEELMLSYKEKATVGNLPNAAEGEELDEIEFIEEDVI